MRPSDSRRSSRTMKKAKAASAASAAGPSRPSRPCGGRDTPQVPIFVMKLWALLEDPRSNGVITWNPNGQNICIMDDQTFARDLLPKYFRHCNMATFVRQLYFYGFRKMKTVENGTMTPISNCPMEFQHPFFKEGKPELLVNIKRKVPAMRTKEARANSKELQAVLFEMKAIRRQQNNMNLKLENITRGNTALMEKMATLQQKDNQQNNILSKILQFIVMGGRSLLGILRKRPLTDASGAPPAKKSCPEACGPMEDHETAAVPEHSSELKDLHGTPNIPEGEAEDAAGTDNLQAAAQMDNGNRETQVPTGGAYNGLQTSEMALPASACPVELVDTPLQTMEGSILNADQAQSSSLFDRKEIQEFLDFFSINIEGIEPLLSGMLNYPSATHTDAFNPELQQLDVNSTELFDDLEEMGMPGSTGATGMNEQEVPGRNALQVFQYKENPLAALLGDPPAYRDPCKLEDGGDVLRASLENRPSVPLSGEASQEFLDPVNQAYFAPSLEDMFGDY